MADPISAAERAAVRAAYQTIGPLKVTTVRTATDDAESYLEPLGLYLPEGIPDEGVESLVACVNAVPKYEQALVEVETERNGLGDSLQYAEAENARLRGELERKEAALRALYSMTSASSFGNGPT